MTDPANPPESGPATEPPAPADDTPETEADPAHPAGGDASHTIVIPAEVNMVALLGTRDELLRTVERAFPRVDLHVRGNEFRLIGPPDELALVERLVDELLVVVAAGQPLNRDAVERSIQMLRSRSEERPADVLTMNIVSSRGRTIRPKTLNQKHYVDAIDKHTIVFGIGPAGTGKTYLAMAKAVAALQAKQVNRIILTRPAVEAGERLGFLPGTLNDKIDPYLRPLYDALHDMVDPDSIPRLMASGTVEVAPLAYMRGRAQPLDAQVLTPEGFRDIGSLRVGDLVIGSDGGPTPVLGVYPQGPREVYRVSTQDGASTLACGEHLWQVQTPWDRRRSRTRVLQTDEMIGRLGAAHARRFELPMMAPPELSPRPVPLDPYALGRLLGDGSSTTTPELAEVPDGSIDGTTLRHNGGVGSVLNAEGGGRGGVIVSDPATEVLRDLGLAGTRTQTNFVPGEYLVNSLAVRLAVLQGLLDTGGEPVTRAGRAFRVRYATTSPRLRDDVVFLVRSLGGTAYCRPPSDRHDTFVLDIRLPAGVAPFRLTHKRETYEARTGARPVRFIDRIEPVGVQETVCIRVAAEDSLYVTDDFLVTHNTLNDAFIILDEAQNTSAEQMKMFLTRLGFGSRMVVTGDVTQVDLPGGITSGLRVVQQILDGVEDVYFCNLTSQDVVRHRLVSAIVDAYGKWDARKGPARRSGQDGQAR